MVKASRVRIAQGPYDYSVSHSPKNWVLGFFKLGLDLRSNLRTFWDRGSGLGLRLDKSVKFFKLKKSGICVLCEGSLFSWFV